MEQIYTFETPLKEGFILRRRNRFIMEVKLNEKLFDCHCPTTGRIGDILLENIPCLLSESRDPTRKTRYTVEAISLNPPSASEKQWIGINQNAVNRYIEYFLKQNAFSNMIPDHSEVLREQKLGASKLDFLVGNTYLEVKMPLVNLQVEYGAHIQRKASAPFQSTDRLIKHMKELSGSLVNHQRAILLICFLYDNPGFMVGVRSTNADKVKMQIQESLRNGVETWQANLKITPIGVTLTRFFNTTERLREGKFIFDQE